MANHAYLDAAQEAAAAGFKAKNVKEFKTPYGVAASWTVCQHGAPVAICRDKGDGTGALSYQAQNSDALEQLAAIGRKYFGEAEPLEGALTALSLLQ